jgi:hypothetical protein
MSHNNNNNNNNDNNNNNNNNNNEDVDATASPLSSSEPKQLSPALVVQLQADISKLRQVIIYQ